MHITSPQTRKVTKRLAKAKLVSGFTLIELLLAVAITSIILGIVSYLFVFTLDTRLKNETASRVEEEGHSALRIINQKIRNSAAINSPVPGQTASQLSLSFNDPTIDPTVFSVDNETLYIEEGAGPRVALTSPTVRIVEIRFENLGRGGTEGNIRTYINIEHQSPEGRSSLEFNKQFYGTASARDN